MLKIRLNSKKQKTNFFFICDESEKGIAVNAILDEKGFYCCDLEKEKQIDFYKDLGQILGLNKKENETFCNEALNKKIISLEKKINSIECEIHQLKYVVLSMHKELIDDNNK